ncbi:lanosterol 14-alpha-demethylase [Coprinopsis marcescibilis]|uniref:Lanosterol 14-alpha-demethylase n=1 Tax=Coprinopsis marcescibilis TaxID=230819 RepID=A0A5C3L6N8_COPMA|nr:lanosterol 14-alpha-demethylase [Coprinopsis marcescibilis]
MSSFAAQLNGTLPMSDAWAGYLAQAKEHVSSLDSRTIVLLLINAPVIAILLNVIRQLVVPRNASEPPEVFHWLPIVGSAISYGNDPLRFFFECREKYGDVFTFILLGRRVTVALGSKGNNFVLGGKSIVFNAEDAYTHLTTPVFGKDVVYDVPNEKFMEQKRFVKVGLSTDNLRAYVGMIEDEVEEFFNADPSFRTYQSNDINEWGTFSTVKVMQEITILTASRTLQGKEIRAGLTKDFAEVYNDLDGGFTPINFMFPNLPLESYRKRDRAQKKMSDFYVGIIKNRREGKSSETEHDMIAALIEQTYRNGEYLKDHEIAHIMIALLMAGQHTSSATGSWTLLHLANNPEVAEALYKEQVENFGTPDGKFRSPSFEELRALPVLDSAIRETLRMHPPIHSIMRYVREDVVVPGSLSAPSKDKTYLIPKGNYVLASPYVSQMDPRVWKNADTWDPARWSDPEGVAAAAYNTYADEHGEKIDYGFGAVSKGTESPYQPFGAGKHRCIGEQFAYLQLGAIITSIVRKIEMRIETVPEHNYHTMIVMPKNPNIISYRRRKFD